MDQISGTKEGSRAKTDGTGWKAPEVVVGLIGVVIGLIGVGITAYFTRKANIHARRSADEAAKATVQSERSATAAERANQHADRSATAAEKSNEFTQKNTEENRRAEEQRAAEARERYAPSMQIIGKSLTRAPVQGASFAILQCTVANDSASPDAVMGVTVEPTLPDRQRGVISGDCVVRHALLINSNLCLSPTDPTYAREWPHQFPFNVPPLQTLSFAVYLEIPHPDQYYKAGYQEVLSALFNVRIPTRHAELRAEQVPLKARGQP